MSSRSVEQPSLGALVDLAVPPSGEGDPDADVVSVLIETPLAHLDRPFDYLVPAAMAADVAVGGRVRVRFAGRELGGYILARRRGAERADLAPLRRAVSAAPVLAPAVARLVRAVARAHGGVSADVVRLAVPPRHAATEASVLERVGTWPVAAVPAPRPAVDDAAGGSPGAAPAPDTAPAPGTGAAPGAAAAEPPVGSGVPGEVAPAAADGTLPADGRPGTLAATDPGPWAGFAAGEAFLRRLTAGQSPGAVVTALPGDTETLVAGAVRAALASGRRALVVAPTSRHVEEVAHAIGRAGIDDVVRMTAEDGTARRYRAFLRALTGDARVVVGTRAAAFAPLPDLGLVVVVEDGDDRLAEPRAPYPHARDVLLARHLPEPDGTGPHRTSGERAALAIVAVGRSVAAQHLVATGVLASLVPGRGEVRARTPRVAAPTETDLAREGPAAGARIPHEAWRLVKESLETGPVLVQVARAGYVPVLACDRCRETARCRHCHGPLALRRSGPPSCRWCGRTAADFRCGTCGSPDLRAVRVGAGRTSHELGRAFPGVPVLASGASEETGVARTVDSRPRLVVATPGAEPTAEGGYVSAILLDGGVATARPGLDAAEEALRRWLSAAALVRSSADGGRVLLLGRPAPQVAQALVRWDPVGFAERELAERTELDLPPAVPTALVQGDADAVRSFVAHLRADERAERVDVLGPVPVEDQGPPAQEGASEPAAAVRVVLRAPVGTELGPVLAAAQAARSARKERGSVRVGTAPVDLL